jgi:hypothetical protein
MIKLTKTEERKRDLKIGIGIGAIEALCQEHKIPFVLRRGSINRHWSVTVMSNTFQDSDILVALQKAFELVLKAKDTELYNKLIAAKKTESNP